MLITIAITVRLGIFILMEIFCVNSLIWFYNWSLSEKCIQIILTVLYFGASIAFLISPRIRNTLPAESKKTVAIVEGIVSLLILYFILTSVRFSNVSVWIILFLQVYICAISIYTYSREKSIERTRKD